MKLHWISPYRQDKNIGLAINLAITDLCCESDDWIVHFDQDAMALLPDTKAHIENILLATDYDLLGCMTNRIRSAEQLVDGEFSDNTDVLYHMDVARAVWDLWRDNVVDACGVMAAFMLCFRVSAWQTVGGFKEGVINFDTIFNQEVRGAGLRVGLMRGIYVFHSYRLSSPHPKQDIKHLLP